MVLTAKGDLNLGAAEELHVRLVSVGSIVSLGGRRMRLLGHLRAYHYVKNLGTVDCRWLNCRAFCDRGVPRKTRVEVQLLLETEDGLKTHRTFLTMYENRLFGIIADAIELEGKDPTETRIRWRRKPGRPRAVEVTILPP